MNDFEIFENDEQQTKEFECCNICLKCGSSNIHFLWLTKEFKKPIKISKECENCGEIFDVFYNDSKKIIKKTSTGYGETERSNWLRKQKLEQLLNNT